MERRIVMGGMAVLLGAILPAWSASALSGSAVDASGLRTLIESRVGSLAKLQVPARNEELPQPRQANGSSAWWERRSRLRSLPGWRKPCSPSNILKG